MVLLRHYMNLEVYSDLPEDLSNMNDDDFITKYNSIIDKSCKLVKRGGYAVFVVGDLRDNKGYQKDFTGITKQAFKKAGSWMDGDLADPEPGDIAYFDFPSDGVDRISHVGIVIKDNEDGTVWCIEGNTSPDKKGSQRNGGQVSKKLRAFRKNKQGEMISIVGFGRPKFKGAGAAKPKAPESTASKCPTCGK